MKAFHHRLVRRRVVVAPGNINARAEAASSSWHIIMSLLVVAALRRRSAGAQRRFAACREAGRSAAGKMLKWGRIG